MKTYDYIITNEEGLRRRGTLQAANQEAVVRQLREEGNVVISVIEHLSVRTWFWSKPHLGLEEKMMFTKHMSTMLKVGITVNEALGILKSQTPTAKNKRMYDNIIDRINSGQTLANSLREYEKVFSEIFVNMVATGEKSGTLESVFEYLDVQLEKEYELRKKVVSAFIYPAVIIGITILLTFGIVVFIMPRIGGIFTSFDVKLPLPTRILMGLSSFILDHPLKAALLFFVLMGSIIGLFRAKFLKPMWHRIFLRLPVFGKILIYVNLARFSRTMNSLLQAGVPITEALQITGSMMGNSIYKNAVMISREKVEQGGKLGESFEDFPKLFPPILTKMLHIGEITGSLETTSAHLAELYEREVDNITRNLSVLLEPILLLFMGLMIGGIAVSIIMPIYQLPSLLEK